MLKINTLKVSSGVILAPMAGITDLPFRMLNRKFGCELAFVEMINVRSVSYNSKKTKQMLSSCENDLLLGIQLLGCEPLYIQRALSTLRKNYKFDILDFNAACPAKKVTRRGEGASLLREPKKLQALLKLIVVDSSVPVTVKIRAGWDNDSVNAKDVALYAQDAGIDALFIHGRTKSQEYSGNVDYKIIKEVKKALDIPVIASGDIFSAKMAKKMFDETGCDGITVARGALGNPWIFQEITQFLKNNREIERPKPDELILTMLEHLDACIDFYKERNGVMIFRKFFAWYTKNLRKVRTLREKASRAKTRIDMLGIIEELKKL